MLRDFAYSQRRVKLSAQLSRKASISAGVAGCFWPGYILVRMEWPPSSAVMSTHAPNREVYDNAYLTLRFNEGAQGRLWYSYVAAGNDHGLTVKVFGETGSLIWWQEEGEVLWHKPMGAPAIRLARGYDELSAEAMVATRVREGHPEGYLEGFAQLYRDDRESYIEGKTELVERVMTEAAAPP
jgi:predicted dehydrogenase